MSDRLTRKEIKRDDQFQRTMSQSLDWVRTHRKLLIAATGALVFVVVAAVGWSFWLRSQEDDAQELLGEAIEAQSAPVGAAAAGAPGLTFATAEERTARATELFEQVREEYGMSQAADLAGLYLATSAARAGDTERARELWSAFVDDHEDSMLAAEARLNLYALDRAEGRGEEVLAELERMIEDDDRPLPEDVILYELGVTLDALGREEEATERYQRLVDDFVQSPYTQLARTKPGVVSAPTVPGFRS